jgi:hypothetical protein
MPLDMVEEGLRAAIRAAVLPRRHTTAHLDGFLSDP